MKAKFLVWLNFLALIITLVVNYLSNSLPLNGRNPAQLSDSLPNLFVPAGSTFAIWGIIYTWLIIFVIWQFSALKNQKIAQIIEKLGFGFIITCALNFAWIFAWHWQYLLLSVLIMICLFLSLTQLNLKTKSGFETISTAEKWLVHAPFGIYWGWISIALIANVTASLVGNGWHGAGFEAEITVAMIIVGTLIALFVVLNRNNIFYGSAVAWALFGINAKRLIDFSDSSQMIATVSIACCIVVLGMIGFKFRSWLKY